MTMVAFSSSTLVPQRRDEIIDRSQDLHLALPNPEVAPPELLAAEFVFAMLSLAASCARLGLVAAGIGCCIVGNPLRFDCEPSTSPLLARLLPATAVALVDVTLTCLRPGPANIGFEGLVVRGGLLRIDDCGVEPVVLRTEADVCCCTCCCANALPWFAVRFTGDGTLGVEVDPVATERTRARRASSGMAERWLRGIFVMKGWFTASLGLRRRSGSQRRQREIKSMLLTSALLNQVSVWWSEDFHDASQLFLFVLTREDGISGPELGKDAAERPHVDAQAIAAAKNDFRAAVEARLNVSIDFLLFAT
jgi:hypothetical protein